MTHILEVSLRHHRLISVLFFGLILQGCAGTVDISSIEGLSSTKPFSKKSFADGSYRFSEGGFPIFNSSVEEAIIERRYDDAMLALVKSNRATDEAYFGMGVVAEAKGYYEGAQVYYRLAHRLNTQQPNLARCPFSGTTWISVQKACYGIDAERMLEAADRARSKARGEWVDTIIEYKDGRTYIGRTSDSGEPEGLGELTTLSGEFYYGYFQNGVQSGPGSLSIKTGSSTLYFSGNFANGEPTGGYLYNPKMKTLGYAFGKDMLFVNGGFYYASGGALGSRPADNNYWFADGWGAAFGRALQQGFVYQASGVSPLLASDDPLISQVCQVQSSIISSAANDQSLCE
jgi:hypothetical protein